MNEMGTDAKQPNQLWRAVEPELTHFHDIISLEFDIATDRGTSDTYQPIVVPPAGGQSWPWQCLTLTIRGGPLDAEHRQAVPIRIVFDGLVYFRFLQDDFQPRLDEPDSTTDIFEREPLRGAAGYSSLDLPDSVGGFCLWECDDSPLVRKFVQRWERRLGRKDGRWLRHFRTSCDELGEFEVVAGNLTIERLRQIPVKTHIRPGA